MSPVLKIKPEERPSLSDILGMGKGYISEGQVLRSSWAHLSASVSHELAPKGE